MMDKIKALENRIAELEAKVRQLEAQNAGQVHYHFHQPALQPQPLQPYSPLWPNIVYCSGDPIFNQEECSKQYGVFGHQQ